MSWNKDRQIFLMHLESFGKYSIWNTRKEETMKRKIAILLIMLMTTATVFSGCGKKESEEPEIVDLTLPPPDIIEEEEEPEEEPVNLHENEAQSYLTGEWIPKEEVNRRPVAMMFGNTVDATPQCGIGEADIVYECLVEGGLTRLMGIFGDYSNARRFGSIRSCRLYYAYFAKEFDAIYAHYGQAKNALSFLNSDQIDNLSGLEGPIESVMYYRDSERVAPHNAFSTPDGVTAGIEKKQYRTTHQDDYIPHYLFAPEEEKITLDGEAAAVVRPGYPINKPWFVYDETADTYKRFQYKKEHIDGDTNEQLAFTNLVFQYMDYRVLDEKGRLEYDTVGKGVGKYFTGGKVVDITWEKTDLNSPAIYYDGNGNQLTMNPGKTCVCIIGNKDADNVLIYATEADFTAAQ